MRAPSSTRVPDSTTVTLLRSSPQAGGWASCLCAWPPCHRTLTHPSGNRGHPAPPLPRYAEAPEQSGPARPGCCSTPRCCLFSARPALGALSLLHGDVCPREPWILGVQRSLAPRKPACLHRAVAELSAGRCHRRAGVSPGGLRSEHRYRGPTGSAVFSCLALPHGRVVLPWLFLGGLGEVGRPHRAACLESTSVPAPKCPAAHRCPGRPSPRKPPEAPKAWHGMTLMSGSV